VKITNSSSADYSLKLPPEARGIAAVSDEKIIITVLVVAVVVIIIIMSLPYLRFFDIAFGSSLWYSKNPVIFHVGHFECVRLCLTGTRDKQ